MKHAPAMGLEVNLNAVLNAKQLLGHSGHIVRHHPALPWQDIPHATIHRVVSVSLTFRYSNQ